MDHVAGPALLDGHVQGVQDEIGLQVGSHRPAHDAPGKRVEHDRRIQKAGPGRDVKPAPGSTGGDVGDPEHVGLLGEDVPVHQIAGWP
jgi:hypothetical protein